MVRKWPRLYSARQYAIKIGKSKVVVLDWLKRGRLQGAQKVDGFWVVPEDATYISVGTQEDPKIAEMAKLFPEDIAILDVELPPDRKVLSNPKGTRGKVKLHLPGFNRIKEDLGYSQREIYRLTKVHEITQRRISRGEAVNPGVVLRLANGLNVEPGEFLKE